MCVVIVCGARPALGVEREARQTIRSDVHARVQLLREEIESLRVYMGSPRNEQLDMRVSGVEPREVYYQAMALYRNADQLCFEHTREQVPLESVTDPDVTVEQVRAVVDGAIDRLRLVKARYGLSPVAAVDADADAAEHTPTELFKLLIQCDRQLNLMLDQRVSPSEVFQQVTLAMGYVSRILEHVPEATPIPDAPAFEPNKRPSDVYRRLLDCLEQTRRIAETAGLSVVKLEEVGDEHRQPGDVYQLASLLVAELAYLHATFGQAEEPPEVYYVGRKFPAHVYQRAGMVQRQLTALEAWVAAHPGWLREGR